ncbi:MAG: alpha/beta hydrolase [Erythrobacter sp.]
MTEPKLHMTGVGAIELATWEWNAAAKGTSPTMVFAHATGFHGRVFDAVIEHFPESHVLSLEMHGHGRSGGGPVEHWLDVAGEVTAVLDGFGVSGAVGIGHSMGAHILLQVAADHPETFKRLTLFDPVVLGPEWYESGSLAFDTSQPHPAARRKREFASPDAMFDRFMERDPYSLYDPRVLRDYCEYGLLPVGDGFELACPPEVEASVYESSRSNKGIVDTARRVEVPVTVVRARQGPMGDFKSSPTWPELASVMPDGTDMHRDDMTHFHPFQDPADAARIIGAG